MASRKKSQKNHTDISEASFGSFTGARVRDFFFFFFFLSRGCFPVTPFFLFVVFLGSQTETLTLNL